MQPSPSLLWHARAIAGSKEQPCYLGRMRNNILQNAIALSDRDLLSRIAALAGTERQTTAELVAHLAALELRPSLYLARGYGSLFRYCTGALRLSEDAACNRIQAAHGCQRFSDPPSLPFPQATDADVPPLDSATAVGLSTDPGPAASISGNTSNPADASRAVPAPNARPLVRPLSPSRYKVQFTIGQETYDKLRWVQAMLRREIPKGNPAEIIDRALDLLRHEIEKTKLGKTRRSARFPNGMPGSSPSPGWRGRAYENRIRPGTDAPPPDRDGTSPTAPKGRSRHIPNRVKRAVWRRDGAQCAFVSDDGRRCSEGAFLELHHIHPYALDGPATVENIALRCRRHNQYEAEAVFGPRSASTVGEVRALYSEGSQ